MPIAYQYYASGYFTGEANDYGGPLRNNATRTAPKLQKRKISCWNDTKWMQNFRLLSTAC